MRNNSLVAAVCGGLALAGPGVAGPSLEIRGAAARVVVIPEARADIQVLLTKTSSKLPIRVRSFGQTTFVQGDIAHRAHGCHSLFGHRGVAVWGRGTIPYEDLPSLIVRTPMDVRITAGDAVFGEVGRSGELDLTNRGCGDWTFGNVLGRARVNQAGSGDSRGGGAGEADLSVAGSGDIAMQAVRGAVTAVSTGSGNISVASLAGPFTARIAGSGDVKVRAGVATRMNASIAGSGGVDFGGVAHQLKASIAGSGDVNVGRVDGPVSKRVFGSGEVTVGR